MTTHNHFMQKILAAAVALGMVMVAASLRADPVEQFITILSVHGSARYSNGGMQDWHECKKGEVLKPGAVIQTSDTGNVDIMLGQKPTAVAVGTPISTPPPTPDVPLSSGGGTGNNGPKANVVHIYPNTVISVDKLTLDRTGMDEVSDTQLDLRAGQILGNVKKISASSRYEIKIPNGVAGIRGTTYMIGANGTVYVLTGSVVISYVDSQGNLQTQTITAGNSFVPPASGVGPGTVVPLTAAQLAALQNAYNHLPNPPTGPTTYTAGNSGLIIHISPN